MANNLLSAQPTTQTPTKGIPMSILWKMYNDKYKGTDTIRKVQDGSTANLFSQLRSALNYDEKFKKHVKDNFYKEYVKFNNPGRNNDKLTDNYAVKDLNRDFNTRVTDEEFKTLIEDSKKDLGAMAHSAASLTKPQDDLLKLKINNGIEHLSDAEAIDYFTNKNLRYTDNTGAKRNIAENNDPAEREKSLVKKKAEKLSGYALPVSEKDSTDAINVAKNKVDYNSDVSNLGRAALRFVPLLGTRNMARENGVVDDNGAVYPIRYYGGLAAEGVGDVVSAVPGLAALGAGIASVGSAKASSAPAADSQEEWVRNVIGPGIAGAVAGKAADGVLSKLDFTPLSKGISQLSKRMNTSIDNKGKQVVPSSIGEAAEYTANVNRNVLSDKLKDVDADAFSSDKYLAIPKNIVDLNAKFREGKEALTASENRLEQLNRLNKEKASSLDLDQLGYGVLPEMVDEGGYNPLINKARGISASDNEYKPYDVNWNNALTETPVSATDLVSWRPYYPIDNPFEKTLSDKIAKAYGMDSQHYRDVISGNSDMQYQAPIKIKQLLEQSDPETLKYINDVYNGSPIDFARANMDQADSYVQEAYERFTKDNLSPNGLKALADEYVKWKAPSNPSPEHVKYLEAEFVNKFNVLKRAPNKEARAYKPTASTPTVMNTGLDELNRGSRMSAKVGDNTVRFNPARNFDLKQTAQSARGDHRSIDMDELMANESKAMFPEEHGTDPSYVSDSYMGYTGDLEVPLPSAKQALISRNDAKKFNIVYNNFNDMLKSRNIKDPNQYTNDYLLKEKLDAINNGNKLFRLTGLNETQAIPPLLKEQPKQAIETFGGNLAVKPLLFNAPRTRWTDTSESEDISTTEARHNDARSSKAQAMIGKYFPAWYAPAAKSRGAYMPIWDLNYGFKPNQSN